jgi:hypothetical protein
VLTLRWEAAAEQTPQAGDIVSFLAGIPTRPLEIVERQIAEHERVVAEVEDRAARTEALLHDINFARHRAQSFLEDGGCVPPEFLPRLEAAEKNMKRSVETLRHHASACRYELLFLESSASQKRMAGRHERNVSANEPDEVPLRPYASRRWALGERFSVENSRFALTDRTCAHCGTHLMVRQRRFCSRYCWDMQLSIAWLT